MKHCQLVTAKRTLQVQPRWRWPPTVNGRSGFEEPRVGPLAPSGNNADHCVRRARNGHKSVGFDENANNNVTTSVVVEPFSPHSAWLVCCSVFPQPGDVNAATARNGKKAAPC